MDHLTEIKNDEKNDETIQVRMEDGICTLKLYRPHANNTINDRLIEACTQVLQDCETAIKIIILEGLPEVFCFGADFQAMSEDLERQPTRTQHPDALYRLWLQLANGPYVTIAHVRGKANAGGIGFVAACDLVLAQADATFSLSELLFGLMPACVLPFLIRRIGFSKAHYLTLMTQPISAKKAHDWGLVDAVEDDSENLLRKHLLRLRRLPKQGILRYKRYMSALNDTLMTAMPKALEANKLVFSDRENLDKIARYVKTGEFPWEG